MNWCKHFRLIGRYTKEVRPSTILHDSCVCVDLDADGDQEACEDAFDGWVCTRKSGHKGLHVACASANDEHRIESWR